MQWQGYIPVQTILPMLTHLFGEKPAILCQHRAKSHPLANPELFLWWLTPEEFVTFARYEKTKQSLHHFRTIRPIYTQAINRTRLERRIKQERMQREEVARRLDTPPNKENMRVDVELR